MCAHVRKAWNADIEVFGMLCSKRGFRLLKLTASPAVGAAYVATADAGHPLPVDFSANASVLYERKPAA